MGYSGPEFLWFPYPGRPAVGGSDEEEHRGTKFEISRSN